MPNSKPKSRSNSKRRKKPEKASEKKILLLSQLYESDDDEYTMKAVKIDAYDSSQLSLAPKRKNEKASKKPRSKSEPKSKKGKSQKPYQKGKYNIKVSPISSSKEYDSKENTIFDQCCVTCTNRNVIRAAKAGNLQLLKQCIDDRKHISTVEEPWSVGCNYTALDYAIMNNDRKMIAELINYITNKKNDYKLEPRVNKPENRLRLADTGECSDKMVGVRIRKLNTSRGNKQGNSAFSVDDVNSSYVSNVIQNAVMLHSNDPSIMDYIKSLTIAPSGNGSTLYIDFASNVLQAIRAGNKAIAGEILKKNCEYNNYGFNVLHSDVLNADSADKLQIKVKTSLGKKSVTNMNITPMHVVCINPDARFIERMVSLGGDWNCLDLSNRKPIHYAAACDGEGPLNYLISLGALIDEGDKAKVTPLMLACQYNRIQNALILLRKGASYTAKNRENGNNAFQIACENGHLELVKAFMKEVQVDVNLPGRDRMTALSLAALHGHYEVVEYLVENGAKVTKKDKFKRTPLLNAIRGGFSKIVAYLLSKGSEYDFGDSSKNSPVHYACAYGWKEILELLLKAGANPTVENDWRVTPMEIAFLKNHFNIVKYLLDNALCDVNTKFNLDMRLLHYSFMKITPNSLEEIKYFLIEKNADVNVQNFYGESVIHLLAKFNFEQYQRDNRTFEFNRSNLLKKEINAIQHDRHKDLIQKIFKMMTANNNLQIDLATKKGKTALQIALENKNIPFIELILQHGPKLNFQDENSTGIMHLLVPLVFGGEEEKKIVLMITEQLKKLSPDDLEVIANSFDDKGFTPLLKLMYTYSKELSGKYAKISEEETFKRKEEIYEERKQSPMKSMINDEEEEEEIEENEEEEEEKPKRAMKMKNPKMKSGFIPVGGGFIPFGSTIPANNFGNVGRFNMNNFFSYNNNNNPNSKENEIQNIHLTQDDLDQISTNAQIALVSFLDEFLSIIKSFIALKCNPHIKVNKLKQYRLPQAAPTIKIESKYFEKNGKKTNLMFLMAYPYLPIMQYFLNDLKVSINDINLYRENVVFALINSLPSIAAIAKDDELSIQTLNLLLDKQVNIKQIDWMGNTIFFLLSKYFNTEMMRLVSIHGSDINLCNKLDENALIYYVRQKDTNRVKILINDFGVDINYQNKKKRTCMHYLYSDETESTNTDETLCDFLLSCKPNLRLKDISGRSPIHYLFVKLNQEFQTDPLIDPISSLSKLMEYGDVDIEDTDIYGNTPLHYAVMRGSTISVLTLFSKKVDINKKNNEGNSPLAYALMFKQPNIAILLIQQGAVIDTFAKRIAKRCEKDLIKAMIEKVKEKEKYANITQLTTSTTGVSASRVAELSSNFDLNTSTDMSMINTTLPTTTQKVINTAKKEEIKEEDEDKEQAEYDEENKEDNNNNNDNDDEDEEIEEYSDASSCNNFNNYNNNPIRGFGNNYQNNNKYVNPTQNYRRLGNFGGFTGTFNNNQNNNFKESANDMNTYNCYFKTEQEKAEGIKLFRICIQNEYQGIIFLCLSNGYPIIKAIEDSFHERKFNLSKKLLAKSPRDDIYSVLNEKKQNLFHILAMIGKGSLREGKSELEDFFDILHSKKISLTAADNEGNTPLHYAASNHFEKLVKFIVTKEKDKKILDAQNNYALTPFLCAIKGENIKTISKELIDMIFSPQKVSVQYEENLYEKGYRITPIIHVVRYILKNNLPLKAKDNSLIGNQRELVHVKILNMLIENKASVMEKDQYGKDALMYAVIENNFELLKHLITKSKANNIELVKNSTDRDGKTLVSYCVAVNDFGSYENEAMLRYLLDNKFDYSLRDVYGSSPVDLAKNQKSKTNIKILQSYDIPGTDLSSVKISNDANEEVFDGVYPYEKDTEDFFEMKKKEAPLEKRKRRPNLADYKEEHFELYHDESGYWDASLTKVNILNGIYGEYMFYFIQLIHDMGKNLYIVTSQFGRIGEEGCNQRSPFNNIDDAKEDFKKLFKSKTGTLWEDRANFQRQKGKYMLLKFNEVQLTHKELLKPFEYDKCPRSNIEIPQIQTLMKEITESSIYFKTLNDNGINTDFFNLSMLNKELLIKARDIVKEIFVKLNEIDKVKKEQNQGGAFSKEKVDKLTELWNKIYILSSRYYELIPKSKFKDRSIVPIENIEAAKQEIGLLEKLTALERAICILLGAQYRSKEINPLDYIYNSLQTHFEVVENASNEFSMIQKYIHNSQPKTKVVDVFRVIRKGENMKSIQWSGTPNHLLLFHGTKVFNYLGIFSNGLKIAPPEAPSTGYLFGKGLYFADMFSKSIQYCDTIYDKNTKKTYSYILLCEVVLGKIFSSDILKSKSNGDFDTSFLEDGYNSFQSVSYSGPNEAKMFVTNAGISVPIGEVVEYRKPGMTMMNQPRTITQYPEYIVYDTSQAIIRYLIKVEN